MFGKKPSDSLTPEQHDQDLARRASGSDDWGKQTLTRCHLEAIRWAVDHKRMSEHPDDLMIRRAVATTGARPRGGDR